MFAGFENPVSVLIFDVKIRERNTVQRVVLLLASIRLLYNNCYIAPKTVYAAVPFDCHEKMRLIFVYNDLYGTAVSAISVIATVSSTA
ncbi:hypothetical protein SAMD00023353_2601320 [Rosellinia necatrix]|uniref:Uncharacterized protein n=1 Tax=Rosellinia necatrix TaxID=77044 RepID=A0A1S8A8A3_ROSNE|nr:hypothetical protein SAMD00023353_2601320 [Rosellinia necatrix]